MDFQTIKPGKRGKEKETGLCSFHLSHPLNHQDSSLLCNRDRTDCASATKSFTFSCHDLVNENVKLK